jgi:hypothetical protein
MLLSINEIIRASSVMNPIRPPAALFFIRTAKNGSVTPSIPRFRPDLGFHPSGEPRPSPDPRGALGVSGREKKGTGPLCRRENTPIRRPVVCTPPSLLPPAYIPPSGVPSTYIPTSSNFSRHASSTRPAGVRPFAWAGGHGIGRRGGVDVRQTF